MGRARAVAALSAAALALSACGGGDEDSVGPLPGPLYGTTTETQSTVPSPAAPNVAVPVGLRGADRRAFIAGRDVARESGCLACHRIGADGGNLGSNLNGIGERLPDQAIRRAIVDAEAPMPSYRELPATQLDALVAFLALLERAPAAPSCPDDSDCG